MPFDPDERVGLPDDTDPDDVLKRLLGPDGEPDGPEDVEETDS